MKKSRRQMAKELRDLKATKAVLTNPTLRAAYEEIHPGCSKKSSSKNMGRVLTPEVFANVKRLLNMESFVQANKDILEKVLFLMVSRWLSGQEKTSDAIQAIRELTKLVPEFSDKLQIEDLTKVSEEELDGKLRSLGFDPSKHTFTRN